MTKPMRFESRLLATVNGGTGDQNSCAYSYTYRSKSVAHLIGQRAVVVQHYTPDGIAPDNFYSLRCWLAMSPVNLFNFYLKRRVSLTASRLLQRNH